MNSILYICYTKYYFVKHLIILSLCFFASLSVMAQAPDQTEEKITDLLSMGNYKAAIPLYEKLIKKNPDNDEFKFQLGKCLLKTKGNPKQIIDLFEASIPKLKLDAEPLYYLGQAYQHNLQFDKAIYTYINARIESDKNLAPIIERQIETCLHAKELIKNPIDVTFTNLGNTINSEFPDYYPLTPDDESILFFTSRRPDKVGAKPEMDGYHPSDIYLAAPKDGKWVDLKSIGPTINTKYDEQAVGISPDGKRLSVYIDHIDSLGNLYTTELNKNGIGYKKIERLDSKINEGFETSGSMNDAGDVFVFASKRKDGAGQKDLYIIRKLSNGKWAKPQDLGQNINTVYNEDFPHLSKDGNTLYFASEGHTSMGGYDLFKSQWNDSQKAWSEPQNLGYPINDTYDNDNINMLGDGAYAYVSAIKDGGFGDRDIYKIKFNEVDTRYCIITGYVHTSDSSNVSIKINILASKPDSKEVLKFVPVQKTGKYLMALTPGNYTLNIKADGYEEVVTDFIIYDLPFQSENTKDFLLKKKP